MDGHVNFLAPAALLGWFPATIALFVFLPARRAVIVSFLAGWMFLPVIDYKIAFLPSFDKTAVICLAVLTGVLLFDAARLLRLRPHWIDLTILIVCLGPFASSVSNGLGARDGVSESVHETLLWGLPWLIGRLYFTDLEALRELAVGIFIGGLVYAPLCLLEIRISPQLHYQLYGFHQHSFFQHIRYGGYRPMVFMHHGLMVGLFMAAAALSGAWLHRSGSLRTLLGIPLPLLFLPLFAVTILIKSVGAIVLLFVGMAILYCVQYLRSSLPVLALAAAAVAYILVRMTGVIPSSDLVAAAKATLGADRAQSLESRLVNEDMLTGRALERPVAGWGGWGRARIHDASGQDVTITDSLWIIFLGNKGLLGLAGLMLALLLPVALLPRRIPVRFWAHPDAGACAVLSVILLLWAVDNLLNGMINPVYLLIAGGLGGLAKVEEACGDENDEIAEEGGADEAAEGGSGVERLRPRT
jgi:hypothetical protein